ncbi:unnamed protein product [Microthlaspi erraticum]|uniref:Uncharacterized protein n=1 Tax=Microthlaspi erraticum TaxID=1685480 RepID=A0A6D2JM24_9BRAS|nr:unnamed protein product [Microthlaspi erraticum]
MRPFHLRWKVNSIRARRELRYIRSQQSHNNEFYILTTPLIKHEHKANLGLLFGKTLINVRHLAQDLESNKKLCVRFGRLNTAIVQHVGITIPNYEPLPNPIPLDLHDLQQIHFLNRWTQNPTKFCYEFPIGPTNTSLVLLPHEDIPSLRSVNQALDRVSKLEKIVECQSCFISGLVCVVRHIAPERLFRPSLTAREPYEPDLGLLEHSGAYGTRSMEDLVHGRSSTGYAKEEGGSHLEDQLDHLLDQPVEFLNSTGQASTRSS